MRKVKAIDPKVRVIKVLHVRGGECVEASLIGSYEKAGVDVFLFDTVSEDGRVAALGCRSTRTWSRAWSTGCTGRSCSPAASRPRTAVGTSNSRLTRSSSGSM